MLLRKRPTHTGLALEMKILLVIDGMHPRDGGPPAVVAGSACALRKRGHNVSVLTTLQDGDEQTVRSTWRKMQDAGVHLVFCETVGLPGMFLPTKTRTLIDSLVADADVVHLHGIWNPILLLSGKVCRLLSKPYLVSVHGVLDHRALRQTNWKWFKKQTAVKLLNIQGFLEGAHAVIFGSQAEAAESSTLGADIKFAYIPNGVDRTVGTESVDSKSLARLDSISPAIGKWNRSLLFFSRIHPEKGLDMLVAAFNQLALEFPDSGILIAGLPQDIAYQKEVENLIAEGPSPEQIVLTTDLTGPGSHFLYGACDAFVLPSHAEGFSMALTEALANGLPTLATRFCHMPEIAEEGIGFVVEPNIAEIRDGLRSLLMASNEELIAMGQRARALFLEKYTWERVAEKLESAYREAPNTIKNR